MDSLFGYATGMGSQDRIFQIKSLGLEGLSSCLWHSPASSPTFHFASRSSRTARSDITSGRSHALHKTCPSLLEGALAE